MNKPYGKVALVTGEGTGIDVDIAYRLAAQSASVWVAFRKNILAAIAPLGLMDEQLVGDVRFRSRAVLTELASVAAFLAADDASYTVEKMIVVDGGQLCI